MCGGGGGGTGGTTKYEWMEELKGPWIGSVERAVAESERQFEPYMGGNVDARISPLSHLHNKAGFNMESLADAVESPANAINAAQHQASSTLNGNYLTGQYSNPYTRPNMYAGESPYFNNVVQQGMDQIRSNYENTTSPELTRLMNLSGALGGSSHIKALQNNQAALGDTLSKYDQSMRNTQYDRSAQLTEGQLGRGMQAHEGERNRMVGAIDQGYGAQNAAMQRLTGLTAMGDMLRGRHQDVLNYQYQNYLDKRNENRYGLDFLTGLMGRAQGGFANIATTPPQYQISPASALMGGLMAYNAFR